jgi:molybdopterin-guanine dinucleotide biosynthesis protein A
MKFRSRKVSSPEITKHAQPLTTLAGYVMAGGGSTRFGQDKARVLFAGQPMVSRMADLIASVTGTPAVVVAPPARYRDLAVATLDDRWPGEGPFGGVVTALQHTRNLPGGPAWNLIVSCDMPFLTQDWLAYLSLRAANSQADIIVPQSAHGLEPLCACWRTTAVSLLAPAFARGVRRVTQAIALLRAEVLDESHWKRFDSAGRLFWNMNTAEDYAEAQHIIESA